MSVPIEKLVADMQAESEAEYKREIQREESLRCCRDVCRECRKGDKPDRAFSGWIHTMLGFDDRSEDCRASAIHERLHREAQAQQSQQNQEKKA